MDNTHRIGVPLVSLVALVCIAILLLHGHHGRQQQAVAQSGPAHRSRPSTTPAVSTSAASTTPSRTRTRTYAGSKKEKPAPSKTASPIKIAAPDGAAFGQLKTKVSGFLQSYYLVKPTDSESTRRNRVAQYVPKKFLAKLSLGLSTGTQADEARIKLGLVQQGTPLESKLKITPATDEPIDKLVSLPVVITVTKPDGKEVSRYTMNTVAWWEYNHKQWVIQNFNEQRR